MWTRREDGVWIEPQDTGNHGNEHVTCREEGVMPPVHPVSILWWPHWPPVPALMGLCVLGAALVWGPAPPVLSPPHRTWTPGASGPHPPSPPCKAGANTCTHTHTGILRCPGISKGKYYPSGERRGMRQRGKQGQHSEPPLPCEVQGQGSSSWREPISGG